MHLRVMTYNVRHGLGNDEEPGGGVDLERTARVIRSARPHIVAVQELDRNWSRSGNVDQPAELARLLGMDHCFGGNLRVMDGTNREAEYGTAIFSVFPILSACNQPLPVDDGWEPRGLLRARIADEDGRELVVLNTHLQIGFGERIDAGTRQRARQAEVVAERAVAEHLPVILMGDFNANPAEPAMAPLALASSGLTDAWTASGQTRAGQTIPCHPAREPEERIDVIFVSQCAVQRVWVVDTDESRLASDHFPVAAELGVGER